MASIVDSTDVYNNITRLLDLVGIVATQASDPR